MPFNLLWLFFYSTYCSSMMIQITLLIRKNYYNGLLFGKNAYKFRVRVVQITVIKIRCTSLQQYAD